MKGYPPARLLTILLAALTPLSFAEVRPVPAPIPTPITQAHTLFLGNAGDRNNEDCLRAYNLFYAGLKATARFQVVLDPGAADLVLELHYEVRPGAVTGAHSNVDTAFARQFRLVLIDPHTRTILWSLSELENNAVFQSNRNKNLDSAVAALLEDFKTLSSTPPFSSASPNP